jgi:hypothetical protein
MQTFSAPLPFRALHLLIVGQAPVQEGPFGSDCVWVHDAGAYRNARHAWNPYGGDAAYAAYQAADQHDDEETPGLQLMSCDAAQAAYEQAENDRRAALRAEDEANDIWF